MIGISESIKVPDTLKDSRGRGNEYTLLSSIFIVGSKGQYISKSFGEQRTNGLFGDTSRTKVSFKPGKPQFFLYLTNSLLQDDN